MNPKPASQSNPLPVIQTPFCGELRSKKYYMMDAILTDPEEFHDASGHTWCYHTQIPVGPDGYRAAPEYCGPGRVCYRSAFAEPIPFNQLAKLVRENNENTEI